MQDPYEDMPIEPELATPSSPEAEEALIGSLLIDPDLIFRVREVIIPDDFYILRNKNIYESCLRLADKGMVADAVTIPPDMASNGKVLGSGYLNKCLCLVGSALNAMSYVNIIENKAAMRKILKKANDIAGLVMKQQPIEDTLREYDALLNDPNHISTSAQDDTQDSDEASLDLLGKITGKIPTGVKSFFPEFDKPEALGGFPIGGSLLIGDSSFGKCLAKGTKVVMYDGTLKKVEDVVVDDLLMGVDSAPRIVRNVTSGFDEMYRIRQVFGKDFVVNSEHILSLKRSTNRGGHAHGDVLNIPANEVFNSRGKYQTHYKCYKTGVEFSEKQVLLEPYFLGLWLGDGTSADSAITNPEPEVELYLWEYAGRLGLGVHTYINNSGCPQFRITNGVRGGAEKYALEFNVLSALRIVGVFGNKHIPYNYLCNSRKQRLELLAGILDSDGYLSLPRHGFEIAQKNKNLAGDIKRLADSLGFRTSTVEKIAKSQNGTEVLVYRMYISGNVNEIPMHVERKKPVAWSSNKDWQTSGFKIERIGIGEYYGFTLNKDGLFLLEDYTVTHNSAWALQVCEQVALGGNVALYIGLESTNDAMVMRRVGGRSGVEAKKVRTASLTPAEEAAIVHEIVHNYQGKYSGRLKLNSRAVTIQAIERAIRKHKPEFVVLDQISQVIDQPTTNPTLNLLQNFTRLKALGNKYDCAVLVIHAISPDESKLFFAKNAKSAAGKKQQNAVPSVNAIPWASQMKFLCDVMLILVPDVNQVLANATVYDILIWIMKDRDGSRFTPTRWSYKLKTQWFTDLHLSGGAQRPSQAPMVLPQDEPEEEAIGYAMEDIGD